MRGVLWVSSEVPDREVGGGGNLHQGHLLVALAEHVPIDLAVTGPVRDDAVRAAVRTLVELPPPADRSADGRMRRRAHAAADAWVRRCPLDVADLAPARRALAERLDRLLPAVDAVLLQHQTMAPLVQHRDGSSARWVVSLHNAAGVRAEQAAAVCRSPLQRALLRRDGANAAVHERAAIDRADALVVITDDDGRRVGRPGTPTYVVPHGVEVDPRASSPLPTGPTVLLAGSLDYAPNVDGAVWFVEEIWPSILAQVPGARLQIVGRHPAPAVVALDARPGVEVHADVPSMAPYLEAARVAVVPLRAGTGVRVKALQAMASGRPVVGTSIGLEGIAGDDAVAVADAPGEFARAVVSLLRDDELADCRRQRGVAFVAARYSWSRSAEILLQALSGRDAC